MLGSMRARLAAGGPRPPTRAAAPPSLPHPASACPPPAAPLPATALRTFSALARNPLILAIFAGLAASALGLDTPTPVANFLDLLGDTAGPCALFALGATLAGRKVAGGTAEVAYMTLMKLVVHPAALFLTTTLLFDVDPLWATAALLGAALPIAANVFIVARQYDVYVGRTSSAILVSTAVSMISVSALLFVLH